MKVCIIENQNNNGFALLRYLNERGIDTDLLILTEMPEHFSPSADSYSNSYQNKIFHLGWNNKPYGYYKVSKKEIKRVIDQYDFIIGSGYATVFCEKIGREIDLFMPYGSDVFYMPFYKFPISRRGRLQLYEWLMSSKHKKAIENANYFMFDYTNEESEKYIERFSLRNRRLMYQYPFIYTPQYSKEEFDRYRESSSFYAQLVKIKREFKYLIFHHPRQNWVSGNDTFSYKGNDKLYRALARVIKEFGESNFALVTFEYGNDVEASKQLIKELGIEKNVFWFGKMFRRDISVGLSMSDIGVGELGKSWYSYGVVYEFLTFSLPVIHHREDSLYKKYYPDMYPMYSAASEEEVYQHLKSFLYDPDSFAITGKKAHDWFVENATEKPMQKITELIQQKSQAGLQS